MAKTISDLWVDNPINDLDGTELLELTKGVASGAVKVSTIQKLPVFKYALVDMPSSAPAGTIIFVPDHPDGAKYFGSDGTGWIDLSAAGGGSSAPAQMEVVTKTAAYVLSLADRGNYIRMAASSNVAVTVPKDIFEPGDQVHVRAADTGRITISAGSGVIITSPETFALRKQGSTATIVCVAENVFDLMGDLEALP